MIARTMPMAELEAIARSDDRRRLAELLSAGFDPLKAKLDSLLRACLLFAGCGMWICRWSSKSAPRASQRLTDG